MSAPLDALCAGDQRRVARQSRQSARDLSRRLRRRRDKDRLSVCETREIGGRLDGAGETQPGKFRAGARSGEFGHRQGIAAPERHLSSGCRGGVSEG